MANGDAVKLQVAIQHGQSAGFSEGELEQMRRDLSMLNARRKVEHDLQMARASCNPDLLRSSLHAAREAGVKGPAVEAAASDLYAMEQHRPSPSPAHNAHFHGEQ